MGRSAADRQGSVMELSGNFTLSGVVTLIEALGVEFASTASE